MPDPNILVNPHLEGGSLLLPSGPVGVLLSHGFGATTAEVRPLAYRLHQAGLTVSCPLLPGHGESIKAINRCHWQDWTKAYQAAYQALADRCQEVFIGGESMGALLALYLASFSHRIAGILTYAPVIKYKIPYFPILAPWVGLFKEYVQKPHYPDDPAIDNWQGYAVYPVPAAGQLFRFQSVVRKRLNLIQAPILVIQGDRDRTVHPTGPDLIRAQARSTSVEIHRLSDSGHCVALECNIDELTRLSLNFIAEHTSIQLAQIQIRNW